MKTRGTVFPGWLNAVLLLSMIAGGIIVSCKTTELPTETARNEADGESAQEQPAVEPAAPIEEVQPAEIEAVPSPAVLEPVAGAPQPAELSAGEESLPVEPGPAPVVVKEDRHG